jgi:hypothetical protein
MATTQRKNVSVFHACDSGAIFDDDGGATTMSSLLEDSSS